MTEAGGTTEERILDAAERLLRRHGLAKTTVVDVARALGMSHGNVYRHFPSKAALRDAVAARWLRRVSGPLRAIAEGDAPAAQRLEAWLVALAAEKRRKVLSDPEMFDTFHALAEAARAVVDAHVAGLQDQLARIVADGVAEGDFRVADPRAAARLVMEATLRFHHPAHVRAAAGEDPAPALRRTIALLLPGLRAGVV